MTCIKHLVPFHAGKTCAEYDKVRFSSFPLLHWHLLHTFHILLLLTTFASLFFHLVVQLIYTHLLIAQSLSEDELAAADWKAKNTKQCPKCVSPIEKNGGCDKMQCLKCHHEFCFSCLAPFEPIRKNGNHYHRDTCRHYRPENGGSWLYNTTRWMASLFIRS